MTKKALFFDVDGTLLSEKTHLVPESAVCAIEKAKALGHMTFINSGREDCLLEEIRKLVNVDGYLCGCGTQLIVHGETVYEHRLPKELGRFLLEQGKMFRVGIVLEAQEFCYFPEPPYPTKALDRVFASLKKGHPAGVKDTADGEVIFDKFCFWSDEESDTTGFIRAVSKEFTVIDRGQGMYECVPLGHSKATAITKILELYDIRLEDAYVFGDSTNDLAMFQAVPNAVLMGKHDKELEPYASFVTKTVEEDGIAYAMEQLGILG